MCVEGNWICNDSWRKRKPVQRVLSPGMCKFCGVDGRQARLPEFAPQPRRHGNPNCGVGWQLEPDKINCGQTPGFLK